MELINNLVRKKTKLNLLSFWTLRPSYWQSVWNIEFFIAIRIVTPCLKWHRLPQYVFRMVIFHMNNDIDGHWSKSKSKWPLAYRLPYFERRSLSPALGNFWSVFFPFSHQFSLGCSYKIHVACLNIVRCNRLTASQFKVISFLQLNLSGKLFIAFIAS